MIVIIYNYYCNFMIYSDSFFSVTLGAVGSPRIGTERLGQVVILRNDNASGIVQLSSSAVTVSEGNVGSFLSVVRSIGTFGEVDI